MVNVIKNKEVEWYFSLGVNRPSSDYYIRYHPITFEASLVKIKNIIK